MILWALAVSGLLRTFGTAGDPALTFRLTSDTTSFRVDSASYGIVPNCTKLPNQTYKCVVPIPGIEKQKRHTVIACKSSGTLCGNSQREADIQCVCNGGSGCPHELFIQPEPKTPTNLTATAVSSSQINLTWDTDPCGYGYIIERQDCTGCPWIEVGRIPPQ